VYTPISCCSFWNRFFSGEAKCRRFLVAILLALEASAGKLGTGCKLDLLKKFEINYILKFLQSKIKFIGSFRLNFSNILTF
jgi:hypothetical protein